MKKFRKSTKLTTFFKILLFVPFGFTFIIGLGYMLGNERFLEIFPFVFIFFIISFCFSLIMLIVEGQWMCRRKVMEECKEIYDKRNMLHKELNPYSDEKYNILLSLNGDTHYRHAKYQYVVFIFQENSATLLILDYNNQKKIVKKISLGRTQIKGRVTKTSKNGRVEAMKLFLPMSVSENVMGQKWNLRPLQFKRRNLQAFMHYFGDNEDAFDNLVKIYNTKYN